MNIYFSLEEVIRMLSNASVLAPIAFYLLKFRHHPKQNHIIGLLVIASLIFDVAGFIRYWNKQSTILLFNSWYLLLQLLLTVYYYIILFRKSKKTVFYLGIAAYLTSYLCISLLVQGINEYQSYVWTLGSLILAIYGYTYTGHQFGNTLEFDKHLKSTLFINAAIVVYCTFSLLMFVLDQYLLNKDPEITALIWTFHNINNIVKNIVLAVGLFYVGKTKQNLSPERAEALDNYSDIRRR